MLYLRNVGSSVVVVSMKDGRNSLGVISLLMGALEPPATLTGSARVAAASAGTWKVVSALTTRQGTRVGLLTVDPNPKFGLGCVCEMENRSGADELKALITMKVRALFLCTSNAIYAFHISGKLSFCIFGTGFSEILN